MSAPTPFYADPLVTVYHGDAVAVLGDLAGADFAAMVTDPPYSSGGQFRGDRTGAPTEKYMRGEATTALENFTGDNRDQRAFLTWCTIWLGLARLTLAPGAIVGLFSDWRQLPLMTDALQLGGFVWRGIVPWHKPVARPALGRFTASCEFLIWGTNGPRPHEGPSLPGFYSLSAPSDRQHPTEKPIDLLARILRVVPEGGTVLDPFCGSGTTARAAKNTGRQAVVVDDSEHWCSVTAQRCAADFGS